MRAFSPSEYRDIKQRALVSKSDEDVLEWCFQHGRSLDQADLLVLNHFIRKLGWNDEATAVFVDYNRASGLADRDDLLTVFEYTEVDERRRP